MTSNSTTPHVRHEDLIATITNFSECSSPDGGYSVDITLEVYGTGHAGVPPRRIDVWIDPATISSAKLGPGSLVHGRLLSRFHPRKGHQGSMLPEFEPTYAESVVVTTTVHVWP